MLAPGDWKILAGHEGYKPITQSYKLDKPLADQSSSGCGKASFTVGGTVIWEATKRSVAGVVVWESSKQWATGALLNATLSSAAGRLITTKQTRTDHRGDFTFAGELQPGQWDVMVLHPDGASGKQPAPIMITDDRPNLTLGIARQMNSTDQQIGRYFFTALCVCVRAAANRVLCWVASAYAAKYRQYSHSVSLVEQATMQIADLAQRRTNLSVRVNPCPSRLTLSIAVGASSPAQRRV